MQINKSSNINFGATFLRTDVIKVANKKKSQPNKLGSFLEITSEDIDLQLLKSVKRLWGEDAKFISSIVHTVEEKKAKNPLYMNHKLYAISEEDKAQDYSLPRNILGLVDVAESENSVEISAIQVDPLEVVESIYKKYENIGSNIIKFLKKVFKKKSIKVRCDDEFSDFFIKNGFNKCDDGFLEYRKLSKK